MAKVSTYLNFTNQTEEAFNFYKTVFGTQFMSVISRYGDIPPFDNIPPLTEADKQ